MKRLLGEKTAAMERMTRKLDEARAAGRGSAASDRTEVARLTDRSDKDKEVLSSLSPPILPQFEVLWKVAEAVGGHGGKEGKGALGPRSIFIFSW